MLVYYVPCYLCVTDDQKNQLLQAKTIACDDNLEQQIQLRKSLCKCFLSFDIRRIWFQIYSLL